MQTAESIEAKNLASLLELSQALSGTLNLKHSLHRVLEILEHRHGMIRSAITLLRENSERWISSEVSFS